MSTERKAPIRDYLQRTLKEGAHKRSGWSSSVGGFDIFDLVQLFVMTRKSIAIEVSCEFCGDQRGFLVFRDGHLVHASARGLSGEAAFYEMVEWDGGTFAEVAAQEAASLEPNISSSTNYLMMEAARLIDERERDPPLESQDPALVPEGGIAGDMTKMNSKPRKENSIMAIKDHLSQLETVEGFQAVAIFNPQGELLEAIAKSRASIKTIGVFANNVLLNAQKATEQMGLGRGKVLEIHSPQAHLIMRCLNEATDFAVTKEGKVHIHAVVVMDPEGNIAMAELVLEKVIAAIAEELR